MRDVIATSLPRFEPDHRQSAQVNLPARDSFDLGPAPVAG
jgi:hypothetical protein